MSGYELSQMIKMWERDQLTTEQAIGQILIHLHQLSERLGLLEKRLEQGRKGSESNKTITGDSN